MIVERKVGDKVYMIEVAYDRPDIIAEANKILDEKIAYDRIRPSIEQWKKDWTAKKSKVEKLKQEALQHYRVTVPLPHQKIIREMSSEEIVISSSQLEVLYNVMNPGIISIIHEARMKLDYNILKAYWNAELDWANMRNTYPRRENEV